MSVSVLCLVGLPGSGKTTLARNLRRSTKEWNVRVVEYDSLIAPQVYQLGLWKQSKADILKRVEDMIQTLKENKRKNLIILDDNFYYRSMRYEVQQMTSRLGVGFVQIFLNPPLDECFQRNSSRTNPIPKATLVKMSSLIEPPDPEKNKWEATSLTLTSDNPNLREIYSLASSSLNNPPSPSACSSASGPPPENSALHYVDLALRQLTSSAVASTPPNDKSAKIQLLLQKKKQILLDVKMKNLPLPETNSSEDLISVYRSFLEPHFLQESYEKEICTVP